MTCGVRKPTPPSVQSYIEVVWPVEVAIMIHRVNGRIFYLIFISQYGSIM